jgi:hypothetical membrane protein
MNQTRTSSDPSLQQRNLTARWLMLAGVVGPILFVGVFTLAGFLSPDYSPIHQAISDLGVGPNGWLLDVSLVINGLLLIGFAVGFALSMQPVLSRGWRWACATLLALHGLGLAVAGLFTEAPATLAIHWMVGAPLGWFGPVVAFFVTGLALRRDPRWHRWGIYLLVASLLTLVLIIVTFWVFTPGTPLASLRLGGLMERALMIEIEAWYVALGWRLFVWEGSHQRAGAPQAYQGEPEQSRVEHDATLR